MKVFSVSVFLFLACASTVVLAAESTYQIGPGDVLEILLDYPLSAERIPETMSSLGHEVLSVDKTGDSSWKILIQIK